MVIKINGNKNKFNFFTTPPLNTLPSVRHYNNLVPKLGSYHSRGERKILLLLNNVCCLSTIPTTELSKQFWTAGAADLPTQQFHLHRGFCLSGPVSHHRHRWCDQPLSNPHILAQPCTDTCRLQSNSDLSAMLQNMTPLQIYGSVLQGQQNVYCSILRFLICTLTSFHIFCWYIYNIIYIYLLQLDCYLVAVVILHVYKIWKWLLINLSREGYMRSM